MKILSVNISEPQTITVNGKDELTGYFKKPVSDSIYLDFTDVKGDSVIDREHHGGEDKACYLYGFNHYDFWQKKYPNLKYDCGMFGENITVDNLDEFNLKIGDTFKIGEAVIQITQPRQPCYKMGIKFNSQQIVNEFRYNPYPGIYVRVLSKGFVKKEDTLQLIKSSKNSQTVAEIYELIYCKNPNKEDLAKALENEYLAEKLKKYLTNKFK